MSVQETLTINAPMILDSTCSYAHSRTDRWPKYATLRMDRRIECRPDIVADARFLPFRENVFDLIYCDPPHLFRKNTDIEKIKVQRRKSGRKSAGLFERYSFWQSRDQWLDFLERTNEEFSRTLKTEGKLYYKLTDGKHGLTRLGDLRILNNFALFSDRQNSKSVFKNSVHYLVFGRPAP